MEAEAKGAELHKLLFTSLYIRFEAPERGTGGGGGVWRVSKRFSNRPSDAASYFRLKSRGASKVAQATVWPPRDGAHLLVRNVRGVQCIPLPRRGPRG